MNAEAKVVQVLGGSISYGRGVRTSYADVLARAGFAVLNRAVPAVGSAFFCASPWNNRSGSVVIETAFNDAFFRHPDARLQPEATMRHLLARVTQRATRRVVLLHVCVLGSAAFSRCRAMYELEEARGIDRLRVDVDRRDTVDGFHPTEHVHRTIAHRLLLHLSRRPPSQEPFVPRSFWSPMWNHCAQCSSETCAQLRKHVRFGPGAAETMLVPGKPSVRTSFASFSRVDAYILVAVLSVSRLHSGAACRLSNGTSMTGPIAYTGNTSQQVFVRVRARRTILLRDCSLYGVCFNA